MYRTITASILALVGLACEPEPNEDPEPLGALEYEHPYARIHRLDRRMEIVLVRGDTERRECGILSERAYTELTNTLGALDPREDYARGADAEPCDAPPGAWVHVEGFDHSPFGCDWHCCRRELARAAVIYNLVENYFSGGGVLIFDDGPYIAIEPDQPCD